MPKVELCFLKNYLAIIQKSIGSKIFQNLYALVDGEKQDILEGGELSCAHFTSFILLHFNLIKKPHATVSGLEKDLIQSGWKKLTEPISGCVVIWGPDNTGHRHIGFCIGGRTVSNSTRLKKISSHSLRIEDRKIESFYWHKKLSEWHEREELLTAKN